MRKWIKEILRREEDKSPDQKYSIEIHSDYRTHPYYYVKRIIVIR